MIDEFQRYKRSGYNNNEIGQNFTCDHSGGSFRQNNPLDYPPRIEHVTSQQCNTAYIITKHEELA